MENELILESEELNVMAKYLAKTLDIDEASAKSKLTKEILRINYPNKRIEMSIQVFLNCIPRRYRMYKTLKRNPISVNTLTLKYPSHRILILTRSSHGNERIILADHGVWIGPDDSGRLFVDLYWVMAGGKLNTTKKVNKDGKN